jgi:hypothetical protein
LKTNAPRQQNRDVGPLSRLQSRIVFASNVRKLSNWFYNLFGLAPASAKD